MLCSDICNVFFQRHSFILWFSLSCLLNFLGVSLLYCRFSCWEKTGPSLAEMSILITLAARGQDAACTAWFHESLVAIWRFRSDVKDGVRIPPLCAPLTYAALLVRAVPIPTNPAIRNLGSHTSIPGQSSTQSGKSSRPSACREGGTCGLRCGSPARPALRPGRSC